MKIILVGYNWCQYLKHTMVLLTKGSVDFSTRFVKDKAELISVMQELCKNIKVQGHFNETSPQIFKVTPETIICVGGHDDLMRIGVGHLHNWGKLSF